MMSEKDIVEGLPFTQDWSAERRALLVQGMNQLQATVVRGPQESLIGVIIINPGDELETRVIPKEQCHEQGKLWELGKEELGAIVSPSLPGQLDVLLLAYGLTVVFCVPVLKMAVSAHGLD